MLIRTGAAWWVKCSSEPLYRISGEGSICWDWPSACKNVWEGRILCPHSFTYLGRGFMMSNRNFFNLGVIQEHRFPWLGPIENKSQDTDGRKPWASLQEAWHFVWHDQPQSNKHLPHYTCIIYTIVCLKDSRCQCVVLCTERLWCFLTMGG